MSDTYKKWYTKNIDRVRAYKAENMRKYRAQNPEKYAAQSRAAKARLKNKVFEMYGKKCAECGFSDIRALTLDHVLNNGARERDVLGERGVYRRALQEENREEYQVLCMNCQFIKRIEAGKQNQYPAVDRSSHDPV
jgi:hypothetical protein